MQTSQKTLQLVIKTFKLKGEKLFHLSKGQRLKQFKPSKTFCDWQAYWLLVEGKVI